MPGAVQTCEDKARRFTATISAVVVGFAPQNDRESVQ